MAKKLSDVFSKIQDASKANDLESLEKLKAAFTVKKGHGDIPFAPNVSLSSKYFGKRLASSESSAALPLANYWSRSKRNVQYRLRKLSGYDGPVVVSEGDSWFQYPIRLDDVIDHLSEPFNIYSLGAAGDLLADIVIDDEFVEVIDSQNADYFLISGGGNDMLGNGRLRQFLHNYRTGMTIDEVINETRFNAFISSISNSYERVFDSVISRFPQLKIFCHSYDYVNPVNEGKWLGVPMRGRGVPKSLWTPVVKRLIDSLSDVLLQKQEAFSQVHFVDCRGVVSSWHDELHPTSSSYKKVAGKFLEKIELSDREPQSFSEAASFGRRRTASTGDKESSRRVSLGSPEFASQIMMGNQEAMNLISRDTADFKSSGHSIFQEMSLTEANVDFNDTFFSDLLDVVEEDSEPECGELCHWQNLFDDEDTQAYKDVVELLRDFKKKDPTDQERTRRELSARHHLQRFERQVGKNNLFEVNFLSRGQLASKCVGRITIVNEYGIPIGTGSGFLVAPGLLLTNNHVIPGIEFAGKSYVIFDYEYDAEHSLLPTERFDLTTDVFVTDEEYDFTFVSVSSASRRGVALDEYGHLPLVRESGKALKAEPTTIIQHANGLPKQIAIRDSRILGRKRQFIYYTTDTNSGSSGGPVLNDDWFPVALHHRAVPNYMKTNDFIANRGIRISSIFKRLDEYSDSDDHAETVLSLIEDRPELAIPKRSGNRGGGGFEESLQEVYHEVPYSNRKGYRKNFLGIEVKLPEINVLEDVSTLNGSDEHWIPYEHFSIVNFIPRKLALVTASNVNFNPDNQRPETGEDYRRKALTGVSGSEGWFKDPRIPMDEQLPDVFYNADRKAFQKGHIVRRNDVTFGESYEQVRRANGDTYHLTNCSPQVPSFNQHGIWAKLENSISRQGRYEKYCVFSGPVFARRDRLFHGAGDDGPITVKVPLRYWKVVVSLEGNELKSFAFVLKQSLRGVRFREFDVRDLELKDGMISISDLEDLLQGSIKFPHAVHNADQIETQRGRELREGHSLVRFDS